MPRAYLHMPDDRVFFGYIKNLQKAAPPFWVTNPQQGYSSKYNLYVRMPDGSGSLSKLQPLKHNININDKIHENPCCFISSGTSSFLEGFIHRYNPHLVTIRYTGRPLVFVRIPDDNKTYFGELNYDFNRRPSWLV